MMNILTVRDNLVNTIFGKEQMLANLVIPITPSPDRMAKEATALFLTINIAELKQILSDVEQCIEMESIK